jgi:peptide chain release factor 2
MKQISDQREEIDAWQNLSIRIQDNLDLANLNDESIRAELEADTSAIEAELKRRELTVLLDGPYDRGNALLEVKSGAGGTESQDWTSMLLRMYLRWAERRGFQTEILDISEGEEAGIKSVTLSVSGTFAYG